MAANVRLKMQWHTDNTSRSDLQQYMEDKKEKKLNPLEGKTKISCKFIQVQTQCNCEMSYLYYYFLTEIPRLA